MMCTDKTAVFLCKGMWQCCMLFNNSPRQTRQTRMTHPRRQTNATLTRRQTWTTLPRRQTQYTTPKKTNRESTPKKTDQDSIPRKTHQGNTPKKSQTRTVIPIKDRPEETNAVPARKRSSQATESASRWLVGSSSSSTSGRSSSRRARATRRTSPPLSLSTMLSPATVGNAKLASVGNATLASVGNAKPTDGVWRQQTASMQLRCKAVPGVLQLSEKQALRSASMTGTYYTPPKACYA